MPKDKSAWSETAVHILEDIWNCLSPFEKSTNFYKRIDELINEYYTTKEKT